MFEEMTEQQAREQILEMTRNYCEKYHNKKKPYQKGDRIPYASRVYDAEEMVNLVDSSLEFWLTAGRYTDEFEHAFAKYLGVRYCSLVNSGSSANLLAFMTLTSPLLKERQILPGDEVITVAAGFPTTVSPMIQYGAVPVFVDVTIPQYNIDPSLLEAAWSPKTKAADTAKATLMTLPRLSISAIIPNMGMLLARVATIPAAATSFIPSSRPSLSRGF